MQKLRQRGGSCTYEVLLRMPYGKRPTAMVDACGVRTTCIQGSPRYARDIRFNQGFRNISARLWLAWTPKLGYHSVCGSYRERDCSHPECHSQCLFTMPTNTARCSCR